MFEQTFKNIDDILHKDAGCSSELDYVEQTSWILFLKYLDDLEKDRKTSAELAGKTYTAIINPEYRWEIWASPKNGDGKIDFNKALTGDDLKDFVDLKLFPYLKKFKAEKADTIEYKIGEIFSELKNRLQSGYNLREVINLIDELRFRSHTEKHEMSHLYEGKIQNMGNAGRNGGEYYTPRPLIKTIVKVVAPSIGDKVYDGAVGSAGFLVESYEYMRQSKRLSTKDIEVLQKETFYGKEKKSLAYIIGIMNMILHGIEAPNIVHTNTLAENLADIQERDRYDIVLANPPFGGKERAEVQQNFPIKTGETAFLFLQHFIKILKAGGRAGIVIKNTFLSNTDNASVSLRKLLLDSCKLHTVLDLPGGVFAGAGVKTVVLFFEKGSPTRKVWFYQLNLNRNLGKTNPLNENDLAEFVALQKTKADSLNSWSVDTANINTDTYDLSVKNPNKKEETALRDPKVILVSIKDKNKKSEEIIDSILLKGFESYRQRIVTKLCNGWEEKRLIEVCEKITQGPNPKYDNVSVEKYRVLKTKNLYDDQIYYEEADRISETVFNSCLSSELKNGDVLLAIVGQGSINKCNVFENSTPVRFIFTRALGLIRTKNDILNPYYLKAYLQSKRGKALIDNGIAGTSGQQVVTTTHIKAMKIPVPPIKEQESIISQLNAVETEIRKLETNFKEKLADLGELKDSINEKAFNGEL